MSQGTVSMYCQAPLRLSSGKQFPCSAPATFTISARNGKTISLCERCNQVVQPHIQKQQPVINIQPPPLPPAPSSPIPPPLVSPKEHDFLQLSPPSNGPNDELFGGLNLPSVEDELLNEAQNIHHDPTAPLEDLPAGIDFSAASLLPPPPSPVAVVVITVDVSTGMANACALDRLKGPAENGSSFYHDLATRVLKSPESTHTAPLPEYMRPRPAPPAQPLKSALKIASLSSPTTIRPVVPDLQSLKRCASSSSSDTSRPIKKPYKDIPLTVRRECMGKFPIDSSVCPLSPITTPTTTAAVVTQALSYSQDTSSISGSNDEFDFINSPSLMTVIDELYAQMPLNVQQTPDNSVSN